MWHYARAVIARMHDRISQIQRFDRLFNYFSMFFVIFSIFATLIVVIPMLLLIPYYTVINIVFLVAGIVYLAVLRCASFSPQLSSRSRGRIFLFRLLDLVLIPFNVSALLFLIFSMKDDLPFSVIYAGSFCLTGYSLPRVTDQ